MRIKADLLFFLPIVFLFPPPSLEPVILELEREPADILFIGHGSVIRCIMAYLQVRPISFSLPFPSPDPVLSASSARATLFLHAIFELTVEDGSASIH
jgi:broad specificity phosphatase PhoE